MVFELFKGKGDSQVETIEAQIAEMLATTNETLTMAVEAVTGHAEPSEVGKPLRKRDKTVNKVERSIRRELLVHAGVRGSQADIPLLLTYMSISKDIERIGDISKDMWELAARGTGMGAEALQAFADDAGVVSAHLLESIRVFGQRDGDAAMALLNELDDLRDRQHEAMLTRFDESEVVPAVAGALLYRYLSRMTAHLMNVLTAVVMPLDRLDYWDEDKVDRD